MNLTVKELKAMVRDAFDNGMMVMETNADRPGALRRLRAEYVRTVFGQVDVIGKKKSRGHGQSSK